MDSRLDFVLPDFARYSWVSDAAMEAWQPRLARIAKAWGEVEWRSVLAGVRSCSLTQVSLEETIGLAGRCIEAGLSVLPLQVEHRLVQSYASTTVQSANGALNALRVAVGKQQDLALFKEAWDRGDNGRMGQLLGYPDCCRAFFQERWVEQRWVDTTWPMADHAEAGHSNGHIEVDGPPEVNVLWRWAGVRAVPHLPCRFDCQPSSQLASQLLEVGNQSGFKTEMEWIREILSWPVEWSALHGISEIKTPILKISARTDATKDKHTVQYTGHQFPAEGASGIRFPYNSPKRFLISNSVASKNGLEQTIEVSSIVPDWYYRDNGFSSQHGLDVAHQPLVDEARNAMDGVEGNVIDFGCGNGLLVKKICEGRSGVIPYGLDVNEASIAHAWELMPAYAEHFVSGDMFDVESWPVVQQFALGIFMIGRLLESGGGRVEQFLKGVKERCARVLVYVYPGWSDRDLETLVQDAGLRLRRTDGKNAGLLDMGYFEQPLETA